MLFAHPIRISLLLGVGFVFTCQAQFKDVPSTEDPSKHIFELIEEYAARYVPNLPNFTCDQTTEQYQAGKKGTHWKQLDSFTSKLVFADGHEHRTLQAVNGRAVASGSHRTFRQPLSTQGEFAILISNIFGEASGTSFEWQGWQMLAGHRTAVFKYVVDREHSTVKLNRSDLATAVVAYHGDIYADDDTGTILRITNVLDNIPPELQMYSMTTTIDYNPVKVGALSYVLPSAAVVEMATPSGRVRDDLLFRDYRKFEAESTVTFGGEAAQPAKTSGAPPP